MYNSRFPERGSISHTNRYHSQPKSRRSILLYVLVGISLLVIINLLIGSYYAERAYPRSRVMGVSVGNKPLKSIENLLVQRGVFTKDITLTAPQNTKLTLSSTDAGIQAQPFNSLDRKSLDRIGVPIIDVFRKHVLTAPVRVDTVALGSQRNHLEETFRKQPVDAEILLSKDGVSIRPDEDGFGLRFDELAASLLKNIASGTYEFSPPLDLTEARNTSSSLAERQTELQKIFATEITVHKDSNKLTASAEDKASWFTKQNNDFTLDKSKIVSFVKRFGLKNNFRVNDPTSAAEQIAVSMQRNTAGDIALADRPYLRTYSYCVNSRGVNASELSTLRAKLAETYTDPRGWNLEGDVKFSYATTDCDYTVWLAAADQMTSFGGVCDAYWSCRMGDNVIINFERWSNASDAWNAAKGSLDDYRSMVINHETGHRLGFGHRFCTTKGAPAPVMQQQSIDLQGCTFNPWPNANELATLKTKLDS